MPVREVQVSGFSPASADRVWQFLRDFNVGWHPAVASATLERDEQGHLIRAFIVHGEDTSYRERLTWFSDSERSLAYTHVQGIQDIRHYNARVSVNQNEQGAGVVFSASLDAPLARADAIANGTKEIFQQSINAIQRLVNEVGLPADEDKPKSNTDTLHSSSMGKSPALGVSHMGENSDTLCLFLHGIGGNRQNWEQQLRAVAAYCKVAAMDLRGYGDSELGASQSIVDDYCADILQVSQCFNASKLVLCGLSYGAWIAASFAMRFPERLAALVLSGGCTGMSEADPAERKAFLRSREAPLNQGKTPADFADGVISVIAGPNIPAAARSELLTSMQAIPTATYKDALYCFTHPEEKLDFSRLTMPTLLMTGEYDKLASAQEIKSVAERILADSPVPDVRYECLSGAGHVCNLEVPDKYNTVLLEHLQRVLA